MESVHRKVALLYSQFDYSFAHWFHQQTSNNQSSMSNRRGGGRILTHQRNTDDVPIIGEDIAIGNVHQDAVDDTTTRGMTIQTRRQHRNRLKAMIEWIKKEYPAYYEIGTQNVSPEDQARKSKWFFDGTFKRDFIYKGLNVKIILFFLGAKKMKGTEGKKMSHTTLRKFNDAILFGAKMANTALPPLYYDEMGSFLNAYKKEAVVARKDVNLDENESDPIGFKLY